MEKFQPVEIDFVINNSEVKADSEKVKADIKSVGQTAEETAAKVDSQLKTAFKGGAPGINATNTALEKQTAIVNRGKPQWNGLGNSINQISREMSAFTVSAQTGFLAISNNLPILADEIGRVSAKNKALTASGEKTVPVWKQVTKSLFSWGTALSLGVTLLTIYGKDVVKFIGAIFSGKEAVDQLKESQNALSAAFNSTNFNKAVNNVLTLGATFKSAREGVVSKKEALEKYNKTLGDVLGKTQDFDVAEANLNSKTPAYVKAMLYRAAATATAAEAAKQLIEDQKDINKFEGTLNDLKNEDTSGGTSSAVVGFGPLRTGKEINIGATDIVTKKLDEKNKEVADKTEKFTDIIVAFNKKIKKAVEEGGLNLDDNEPGTNSSTVSQYQSLLDKLSSLDKEYSRKSYTKDEEELQALKDKFESIRTLVKDFNSDPKNKAQIIDLTGLDKLESEATTSLTYRQATEKLKTELSSQKQLFEDFENYKKQFGISAAESEFKAKLNSAESYYDYLKSQQKENDAAYKAVDNGTATGAQIERVKLLNEALKKEAATEKKLFEEQLASLLSYQQERKKLIETYEADRKELVAAGETTAVAELDKKHKEELENLDDTNAKKLTSYKELFKGIAGLSAKEVKQVLANAKQLLNALGISAELKASIAKKIAEIEQLLTQNKYDAIFKYSQAIGALGEELQALGDSVSSRGLADAGSFLSGIASSAGEVLTILDTMGDGSFSDLSSAGKADVITAGINGAITLVGVFASAAQKRKEAEEAYYLSVIGFQDQYNLSLQEQIRLRSILDENVFLKDYEGRITDALSSLHAANEEYEKSLQNLIDKGQVKTGQRNAVDWGNVGTAASGGAAVGAAVGSVVPIIGTVVGAIGGAIVGAIGGLFGGTKKKDVYSDALGEYPELIQESEDGLKRVNVELAESLLANDLVNKKTKQILENLLDWEDALEAARDQIKEVITDLSGSLGTDIKANLVDAFESGESAAIKMGDTIEKVLENVLSSLIFNSIFDQAFTELETQMAKSFDIGGDGTWVDDFSRFFEEANGLTDDFNAAMEAAQAEAGNFGFDVFKPDSETKTGLTGEIRRDITEETGSILAGLARGQFDVTKRILESAESYYEQEKQHHTSVLSLIAINTRIATNTEETVKRLDKAVELLGDIAQTSADNYYFDQTN